MAAIDGLLRATHQELGAPHPGTVAGRGRRRAGAHAQLKLPGAPVDDGVVQTDGRHHSAEREPEPELLSAAAPPGGGLRAGAGAHSSYVALIAVTWRGSAVRTTNLPRNAPT